MSREIYRWSPELVQKLISLLAQGLTYSEAASKMGDGISVEAIKSYAYKRRKLTGWRISPKPRHKREEVMKQLESGLCAKDAEVIFNLSAFTIRKYISQLVAEGRMVSHSVVLAAEIAYLSVCGMTAKNIAQELNDIGVDSNLKQVEYIRSRLIRDRIIPRHQRGRKSNQDPREIKT